MRTVCLMITALSLTTAPALAQDEAQEAAQSAGGEETVARPGADAYTQRTQAGIALLTGGDTPGAMGAFREAIEMDGARPMAAYYLAAAQRMSGNLDEALAGFRRAAELAQSADAARWQARALQGVADTLERMEGRIADARTAWEAYIAFADSHQTVAFPQMGRAHLAAIDRMLEQEGAYGDVRERIAARERELAEAESESQGSSRGRRR
ncbi:MAG: hypothetical protein RLO52_23705 [Sandaracinaceae bacterium]